MRFLTLGATGMAGHLIAVYLKERGHDVTAYSRRSFPCCKNIVGDAMNASAIQEMLAKGGYDVVINCIGLLNQFCDRSPSAAVYLNSYLPHLIADTVAGTSTRLIHLSTDCVFSGKRGRYSEKDFRDGESLYDRTKALGEVEDDRNLTFRNSIVGPDMDESGIGLFNWFMKQTGPISGFTKVMWTGVTTLVLAQAIEEAAIEGISGIYNLVNGTAISKHDLLCLFNKHMRNGSITVVPSSTIKADKSLVNTRKDFRFVIPDYEEMTVGLKEWILAHKELYPHYFD